MMHLFIGGARGSSPWTDPSGAGFGGDTTAFMIQSARGTRVLIDAGSGIRHLEPLLRATPGTRQLLLLFTHYHLDHIIGLPTLRLLDEADWAIRMAAPERENLTVEDAVHAFIRPPWWPVPLPVMAGHITFRTLPGPESVAPEPWLDLQIRWCPVHHPNGCTAYRLDDSTSGKSVVIATDLEWGESSEAYRESLTRLCRDPHPASLLVFDGRYAQSEYESARGWGHSTWEEGIALAEATGIKHVVITHHGQASDQALTEREHIIQARFPRAILARQGACIKVR